jgi:hypothetical protein
VTPTRVAALPIQIWQALGIGGALAVLDSRTYNDGVALIGMIPLITRDIGRIKLNAAYFPKFGQYKRCRRLRLLHQHSIGAVGAVISSVLIALFKALDLSFGLILGNAVSLLDLSGKLVALSRNRIQVVIGQFSPLFLDLSLELLPVARNDIPVHLNLLVCSERERSSA